MQNLSADILFTSDRRTTERRDKRLPAKAVLPDVSEVLTCELLDISPSGARIRVEESKKFLPSRMKLFVPKMQLIANCEQKWRKGQEVGLEFDPMVDID